MSKNLVKYVAVAACGYLLVYVGVHLLDERSNDALPMLAALMAIGTLLAGHRLGPGMCTAAGALAAVFGTITIATRFQAPGLAFTVSYVAAALVALAAGVSLMRRAPAADDGPTT